MNKAQAGIHLTLLLLASRCSGGLLHEEAAGLCTQVGDDNNPDIAASQTIKGQHCQSSLSHQSFTTNVDVSDDVSLLQVLLQKHENRQSRHSAEEGDHTAEAMWTNHTGSLSAVSLAEVGSEVNIGPIKKNVRDQNYQVTSMHRYPAIFQGLQELLANRPNNSLKLLSFGCSDGSECRTMRTYFPGATIHGVDVDPILISHNIAQNSDPLIRYFQSTDSLQAETYDAVLAMSVLCRQETPTDRLPYSRFVESLELIDQLVRPGGFLVMYNADFPFDEYPYSYRYQNMATGCDTGLPLTILSADLRQAPASSPDKTIQRGVCAPWGKYCIESGWRNKFSYLGKNVQPAGSAWLSFGCMFPGTLFNKLSAIPDMKSANAVMNARTADVVMSGMRAADGTVNPSVATNYPDTSTVNNPPAGMLDDATNAMAYPEYGAAWTR